MNLPLRHTLSHHRHRDGGTDSHGNPVSLYTPPLDETGIAVRVYGWGPARSSEPDLDGHTRVITEVEVYAPAQFHPSPADLIDLPSGPAGRFEVIGVAADANHGPFDWTPGNVITLRKVDG
ncbi:hypothetical protein [Nocardia iowensis]|uniref:Head-to-tail stopper n=1 Tax=Nocardia iowensis TaxID=204891 RepID=A0ABX8RRK8_NOCIO|nr:hypothetical protein [Nocardia iowensis]QXN91901.1 hypothetical protein KV110_01525 [Nocardia iowensis]